jgi:glycine/D-amino acid oxidase-like deaminating enzyme
MGDVMLPFAKAAYEEIGSLLGTSLATDTAIHTYFSNAEEAELFERKSAAGVDDVLSYSGKGEDLYFNYHYGVGTIHPALLVDVRELLGRWRAYLKERGALLEAGWEWNDLRIEGAGVVYGDIKAGAVIDCTGAAAFGSPYFSRLPFALNKGEVIIADMPELPREGIYKYAHLSIVPWGADRFWVGSTFDWDFKDELPTEAFRLKAEGIMKQWLRVPFRFEEHFAAIRPATVTREAFAGMHPLYPQVGILNGMGSKGCSLAPFLGDNLAGYLLGEGALIGQVDVERYARVLGR